MLVKHSFATKKKKREKDYHNHITLIGNKKKKDSKHNKKLCLEQRQSLQLVLQHLHLFHHIKLKAYEKILDEKISKKLDEKLSEIIDNKL